MSAMIQADVGVADAIFHRRAVRSFSDRSVEAGSVKHLLAAAVQAPSALNQQPWVFAVFHGRKRLKKISDRAKEYLIKTYPTTFEVHSRSALYENPDYDIFHGANTLIVIYATRGRLNPNEDCCLAAENLMLAAYGMGLGTCPIGFARPWLDLFETKRELGVPEEYSAVFPLVVGYPAGVTPQMPRDEPKIVCWKWDEE
ncbi:MAG TPA: nitroreductase family protein [Opitutus sp.]|nr:nitroreductase family protein [Opitutus sp.]